MSGPVSSKHPPAPTSFEVEFYPTSCSLPWLPQSKKEHVTFKGDIKQGSSEKRPEWIAPSTGPKIMKCLKFKTPFPERCRYWLHSTLQAGKGAIRAGKTIDIPKGFTGFTYSCNAPPPPNKVTSIEVEFYSTSCLLPHLRAKTTAFTGPVEHSYLEWPQCVPRVIGTVWKCFKFKTPFPEGCQYQIYDNPKADKRPRTPVGQGPIPAGEKISVPEGFTGFTYTCKKWSSGELHPA
ncbi:hypothetical protein BDP27DRAFT_1431960 [Rhodocollybia butyracea]|uniref:Uncharacterized protein n=1 Tax=Rhodocollybia butyracea TaxID=206335 RepID=A0A9P5TY66_9AGAR|nr:hypothetical protein BDP27DRAFT_1431960 [Rhodocollybia butyracea]